MISATAGATHAPHTRKLLREKGFQAIGRCGRLNRMQRPGRAFMQG
jgi:hypothetical protein